MSAIEERITGYFVVTPVGGIDINSHGGFKQEIDSLLVRNPRGLIFDFVNVDFINSMGLGVVLTARKAMENAGADFGLINLQPQVEAVFEIVKALPNQKVFASVEEMDNYLAAIQKQVKERDKM